MNRCDDAINPSTLAFVASINPGENMTEFKQTKVALIREPGYRVGYPAPLRLNCPCKNGPVVDSLTYPDAELPCGCGRVYSTTGWVIR